MISLVDEISGSVHTPNNLTEKQEVAVYPSPSGGKSKWQRFTSLLTTIFSKKTVLKLESELEKKTALIDDLERSRRMMDKDLQGLKIDLDKARCDKQEILEALGMEKQWYESIIVEWKEELENEKLHSSQLATKCQKQGAELATLEKKAAQDSLTTGSYPDDHANPGMLGVACKAVDKATEDLARVLHGNSVTKALALGSEELEDFVHKISSAHPAEFSRAFQMKYAWCHWICVQMFQGFEHVFFDVDGRQLTSPLNSKKHALECFRRFQQKQSLFSSGANGIFQAFCNSKYRNVFPESLVSQAFRPNGIVFNEHGRFNGDGELFDRFMDVARAVWLLHELAFSFDPPATILRMARGTPYDEQFHEPVIHVEDGDGMPQVVMLMTRPAFRVRKSTIRSRVLLCQSPNTDVLTHA